MSEAAMKVIEAVMDLEPDDRRMVTKHLQEYESAMAQVPQDVQDEIMAEVERRIAEHEANPHPMATADEAFARIFARLEARRAKP
jgi:putative addiction module component (TIGR02574 family)